MICNSLTYKVFSNVAFTDGHVGIWHAQGQWTKGVEDIAWSIDDEESRINYALCDANSPTIANYVVSLSVNYTLDNGHVGITELVRDAQGNTYSTDDPAIIQATNYAEILVVITAIWAIIGG